MKKINLVEILKDCPKGMELDCTMYDTIFFYEITSDPIFPIRMRRIDGPLVSLTKYGEYANCPSAKCVIFPKGKTSWEGFVPPCKFKNGDILVHTQNQRFIMSIYHKKTTELTIKTHCILWDKDEGLSVGKEICCYVDSVRFATEEEKAKLFQAIEEHGYKWNAETKTLEKLIKSEFKDGDIIFTHCDTDNIWISIFKRNGEYGQVETYVDYRLDTKNKATDEDLDYYYINNDNSILCTEEDIITQRLATEEEKQKLFKAIENDGYKWNEETKTLERSSVVKPEFKVGDKIKNKRTGTKITINKIHQDCYECNLRYALTFENQNKWELVPDKVPNKFDINTLIPFESRVLMRSTNAREWVATFYSHYSNNKFYGCGMCCDQCIPYEGNEHLLGKTDDCNEYFKTWKD